MQTIGSNGFKRFQKGGDVLGGYMLLGKDEGKLAYVCEGFATGRNVYIAFSATNLAEVASNQSELIGAVAADAGAAGIAPPPFTPR